MSKDLTAILLKAASADGQARGPGEPGAFVDPAWVESVIRERGRPAIVRIAPLPAVGLLQVEVSDVSDGLPTEDPELVGALSARGQATFLHVNHEADQAILHGFDAGTAGEGFVGKPGEDFTARLRSRFGCDLDALHAADDQTRTGIGVVGSRTAALLPGRSIVLPIGMPSALGSFTFHDRAVGAGPEAERCAFFAFDRQLVAALSATPGAELARIVEDAVAAQDKAASVEASGALVRALTALGAGKIGEASPEARPALVRAMELIVLGSGRVFAGGDRADYWDGRVLPLLSLEDSEPVIDEDDLPTLDATESLLHALVEIVPFASPPGGPGTVLETIGDRELAPLLPALAVGASYSGSILQLDPTRLLERLRKLDGERLTHMVERLERSMYRAKFKSPAEGEAFQSFRRGAAEAGQTDIDRVLRHLSELRIVLEVAAVNDLVVALAFYG